MRVSKSRNVCGYVKAYDRHQKLAAKLAAREQALLPLQRKVTEARVDLAQRRLRMTGGQVGEAERIIRGLSVQS